MDTRLLTIIRADPVSSFKKGATERLITLAEKRLTVSFPPSYRDFLRHFNGGEFRFARMYRVSRGGAGFFDLLEEMAAASECFAPFRDRTLLLFGDDYSGNYFCFDLRHAGRRGECPVVFWNRLVSEWRGPEPEARSLREFVVKGLRTG
jgi:hypothetical protein